MSIEICDITKHFGAIPAVNHVSLQVATGELVALLGPSGCGKTTLLRIVAGLEPPDPGSGPIRFNDENVAERDAGKRGVGFVFQHYALFRHMTVFENIAFGLRVKRRRERPVEAEIRRRVNELIQLIQLETFAGRYPHQLSGGQRQRVALARALAVKPKVLLLDEPFGALDAKVRVELRRWLRRLHDEIQVTSVFVTHDQDEALEVADRIVVMNEGRVIQVGSPEQIFHHPETEFVMHFLGQVNQFHGRLENGRLSFAGIVFDAAAAPAAPGSASGPAKVIIRPHEFDLALAADDQPAFPARVEHLHAAGSVARLTLVADSGETFHAEISLERLRELDLHEQQRVYAAPRQYRIFAENPAGPGGGPNHASA